MTTGAGNAGRPWTSVDRSDRAALLLAQFVAGWWFLHTERVIGQFSYKACSVVAPQFNRVAQAQAREDGTEFVYAGRINDAAEEAFIG
ncbi:hypothetical protein AB0880_00245 [Micromonospora chersina]|uniref:hypothetical protein n=1 Tax=Micromonospora chersina TaxID=47854 RepID=UPI003452C787